MPAYDIAVGWAKLAAMHSRSLLVIPCKQEKEEVGRIGAKNLMGFTITGKTGSTLGI